VTSVRVFVDSGFMIAAYRKRDVNHERARKTLALVLENDLLVMNELILAEIVTFFRRRDGYPDALRILEALKASPRITILLSDPSIFEETIRIFTTYDSKLSGFSFADASVVATMKRISISFLLSYDSDFDSIKEITRLTERHWD
jgi:predicted nucleic acid-binding protein